MVVMVFYVHVVLEPGAGTHDKQRPGLFCFCLFISNAFYFLLYFFFICCPQSHISHYYVRSVFPHCNGSKLHKSPNPARPPRLAQKICQHLPKKENNRSLQYFISRISPRHTQYTAVLDRSDSQSGNNKVQFSHTS